MMKPEASPLRIIDFAITRLNFDMIFTSNVDQDFNVQFRDYPINIDFDLERNDYIRAYIKADVNKDKEMSGYSISAEAVCIFEIDKKRNLSTDVKESMEGFSTIYIALNSLRGLLSGFTANAPFGRYILPSIDLNDLIEKKKIASQKLISDKKTPSKNKLPKKSKVMKK